MEIQHITFPHPAFSEVGPRLLMKEFAPERIVDLETFISKDMRGIELKCGGCGSLNSLEDFSCARCSSALELRHDLVIENNGAQAIKPNTLRAWCTGIDWKDGKATEPCHDPYTTEENFPGACINCKKEGTLKYSGVVGSEKTELMFALCLALSDRLAGNTTNLYQAFLSAGSADAALGLLAEFKHLKKRKLDLTLSRIINQPDYYILTPKGEEALTRYSGLFANAGLPDLLRGFIDQRIAFLQSTPTLVEGEYFKMIASKLRVDELPQEVRNSLLLTELPEDRFRRELADYATVFVRTGNIQGMPVWLRNLFGDNVIFAAKPARFARRQFYEFLRGVEIDEHTTKMNLLKERGSRIRFTKILTPLRQYMKHGMLTDVERTYLLTKLVEPARGVRLAWRGVVQDYELQMPGGRQLALRHVASADRDNIIKQDYERIWTPKFVETWKGLGRAASP